MKRIILYLAVILLAACIPDTISQSEESMELREKLTPIQFHVTQENGTEPPFSNEYWNNKEEGIYVDIVSGEVLFSSAHKYDSGTGWPSFYRPVNESNIKYNSDYDLGYLRTEVRSKGADSHLGHVFSDGPKPTGQRYCINSAALRFVPKEQMKELGYEDYLYLFDSIQTGSTTEDEEAALLPGNIQTAYFGGGCFWCTEAVFERLEGVIDVVSGYAGGNTLNPTYEDVTTGKTGHAEVIKIDYDPQIISFSELLEMFFKAHDPTTLNRQGADVGTQYRSIILYTSDEQKSAAEQEIVQQADIFGRPMVTEIVKFEVFYPAEEYHQDFYDKNPEYGYCTYVIAPKIDKLDLGERLINPEK